MHNECFGTIEMDKILLDILGRNWLGISKGLSILGSVQSSAKENGKIWNSEQGSEENGESHYIPIVPL